MNRKEIDQEAKATKSTRNVWMWIVGIGIILMIIAFVGGVFNHGGDVTPNSNTPGAVSSDTVAGDYGAGADTSSSDFRNP
ncbi:hypothetical protein GCM10027275_33040 [Rhabdobacter roseus]|uniref:Uncharacterized protein n=1 Tax=Rhabdobacter roseus TaxID=1655419 RepID=A0A840TQ64_9BACT|nr:hypothetical protein [Rhabdobacter roseus]MBB5285474.1 hypothetical protein [Rhabdobacter roseus]